MGNPETMKVKFENGPLRRDIPLLNATVERNKPLEVDTEIGDQLIDQGWTKVSGGKPPKDAGNPAEKE